MSSWYVDVIDEAICGSVAGVGAVYLGYVDSAVATGIGGDAYDDSGGGEGVFGVVVDAVGACYYLVCLSVSGVSYSYDVDVEDGVEAYGDVFLVIVGGVGSGASGSD